MYDPNLPAGSSLGKSYEYGVDVSRDGVAWLPVRRALNIVPALTPITQDGQSYDDKGAPNAKVSSWAAAPTFSAYVNRSSSTGELVPELKVLDDALGELNDGAEIYARIYHKPADGSTPNPREAWQGKATVGITRANVAPDGTNELWNIALTGAGAWKRIANPFQGWVDGTEVPSVTTVGPVGQSVGEQIIINGSGFTGVTEVTIDALPAEWAFVSGSTLVAVIPATAAGAAPVVVTNAAGSSAPFEYTVV